MFTRRCKADPKIHLSLSAAQDEQGRKAALPLSLGKGTEVVRKDRLCLCLFLASLQQSSLKPLHSSSLTFFAGSSQAHLISSGKQKRQTSKSQKCSQSVHPFLITVPPVTVQRSSKRVNKSNFSFKTGPCFLQFSGSLGVWHVKGSFNQMYIQQKVDIGKEKSPWIMCLMQKNAIKLFFMEVYPSETADFSFIIFSNTNSWELCLGSLQIKCWRDSGGVKGHLFLLLRPAPCCHSWWILSLRLFLGIKHLAFVAGSCYKEQERRFNYVPWHGEREWATTECWCKGKEVMQQSLMPWTAHRRPDWPQQCDPREKRKDESPECPPRQIWSWESADVLLHCYQDLSSVSPWKGLQREKYCSPQRFP